MANYFTCKLTVWGYVDLMKEFYAVLNSDSNETPGDKFRMNKFIPIPEILFDESLECEFSPVSVLKKSIKRRNQNISVDSMGRTEEVFNALVSCVEEEYGTSSIEEWYENNWGCEEDLEVIEIISFDEKEFCVMYNCVWCPNSFFVKNLHELYPKLRLTLEYVSEEELNSATLEFYKNKVSLQTHSYQDIFFQLSFKDDSYIFVNDYEDANCIIALMGADWVKSLKDDGFTNNNVENWDELVNHLKDYDKEL